MKRLIYLLIICLSICCGIANADFLLNSFGTFGDGATPEDFTTYSDEVDPNSHFAISSATLLTISGFTRGETAYLADDKGASHFSGNFTHQGSFQVTDNNNNGILVFWALTNSDNDVYSIESASGDALYAMVFDGDVDPMVVRIREIDGGTRYSSSDITVTYNTQYWWTVERDEGVGTYGTLYFDLYSDASRETQVGSQLSITLHSSAKDFQNVQAAGSYNTSESEFVRTGYVYDLYLNE